MAYVRFDQLTAAQQAEAHALRPKWLPAEFVRFEFWLKPDAHVSRRGGHHQLTPQAYADALALLKAPVRSKGDLAGWKPGTTFHVGRG